jgi:hypothetical protein
VTPDERFAQWVEWVKRIKNPVHTLFLYRHIFEELGEMTRAADLPPSTFFDALPSWYASAQASAVRRQVDMTRGTISLRRLLHDIAAHPGAMSRERYVAHFQETGASFVEEANRQFDQFAGPGGACIDRKAVRDDIAGLEEAADAIERHTNERIAHLAQNPTSEIPTWSELHGPIDVIGDLLDKYYSLLTGDIIGNILPEIQEDWRAPFRQPWITD